MNYVSPRSVLRRTEHERSRVRTWRAAVSIEFFGGILPVWLGLLAQVAAATWNVPCTMRRGPAPGPGP